MSNKDQKHRPIGMNNKLILMQIIIAHLMLPFIARRALGIKEAF